MDENLLYYGDNLDVLRRYVKNESVDLIYLDPPFKSNQDYNVLFAEQGGSRAASQIKAFEDTWHWDMAAAAAYQEVVERGGKVSQTMQAFRLLVGDTDMLAYLSMMAPRLVELHRVLKSSGSIYLHCDPTASHYLKLLMDAVFEAKNFRNEVIWWYRKWSKSNRQFLRNHDVLLFYTKGTPSTFHVQRVPLADSTMRRGTKQIILSVKAGHTDVTHIRDLRGVLEREKADMGALISMQNPTQPMRTEAASASFYTSAWSGNQYPRIQILTIADLLAGKGIDYPRYGGNVTFKKAPKANRLSDERGVYTPSLLGDD